ncbi:MAG: BamA/TamA family outer membrane protein [Planctomycetota bacterium]
MRRAPISRCLTLLATALLSACSAWTGSFQGRQQQADGTFVDGRVVDVDYVGNDNASALRLGLRIQGDMKEFSLEVDKRDHLEFAAGELESLYQESGFPDVHVGYEVERPEDPTKPVVVRFLITEGPRVLVTGMALEGNEAFDDDRLLELWDRQQSGFLGTGEPLFYEPGIRGFASKIATLYISEGWPEVRVSEPEVVREEGSAEARVTIRIREGTRYRIQAIEWPPALAEVLGDWRPAFDPGQWATFEFMYGYAEEVRRRLTDMGYHRPQLLPDPNDPEATPKPWYPEPVGKGELKLTLAIDPGRQVTVGEIVVRGNTRVLTSTILSQYRQEEGVRFSGTEERLALRRLFGLGLFEKVEFQHEDIDDDTIRVVIKVEEDQRTRWVEGLYGWGSWDRWRGGLRFQDRSLFGTGLGLTVEGIGSSRGYRTGATLTEPDLFASETRMDISGRFYYDERPSYTEKALEANLAFTRYFLRHYKTRLGYLFKDQEKLLVDDPTSAEPATDKGSVYLELGRDERDNVLFPSEGWRAHSRFEVSDKALGGDIDFNRVILDASGYVPITRALTLVASGEAGALWPQGGLSDVPISERFFNGGASTVRSFAEDQLGPKLPNGEARGGQFRTVWRAELRVSPFPRSPLQLALFADAGNVGIDVNDFGFEDMRYGIGPGIILVTPAIPIRFDAGYNPDRRPGEDEWVLHLTIGSSF